MGYENPESFFYRDNLTLEQYIKDVTGDSRILNGKITSMGKKKENTTKEEDKRKLLIEYKDTLKDVMKAKKKLTLLEKVLVIKIN